MTPRTYFVERSEKFADGTGPGVDIYQYDGDIGFHTPTGAMLHETAKAIYGDCIVLTDAEWRADLSNADTINWIKELDAELSNILEAHKGDKFMVVDK